MPFTLTAAQAPGSRAATATSRVSLGLCISSDCLLACFSNLDVRNSVPQVQHFCQV